MLFILLLLYERLARHCYIVVNTREDSGPVYWMLYSKLVIAYILLFTDLYDMGSGRVNITSMENEIRLTG